MEIPSSITDKEIHNYLSEIKHQLAFTHSPKETASIMQMVESSIDDFLSEHPFATINDLSNHFGDTDEFKEMFISCAESEQLKNHLDNSQKKAKICQAYSNCYNFYPAYMRRILYKILYRFREIYTSI